MDIRGALLWLNAAVSLASSAWAVAALYRPATLSASVTVSQGERFYVRMYAARALPLGVAAGVLPFWSPDSSAGWIVLAAGLAQFADVWIGLVWRKGGMIVGASLAVIIHLCAAWVLLMI